MKLTNLIDQWESLGHDASSPDVARCIEAGMRPIAGADDGPGAAVAEPPAAAPAGGGGEPAGGGAPAGGGEGGAADPMAAHMDQLLGRFDAMEQRLPPAAPQQQGFDPADPFAALNPDIPSMPFGAPAPQQAPQPPQAGGMQGQPQSQPVGAPGELLGYTAEGQPVHADQYGQLPPEFGGPGAPQQAPALDAQGLQQLMAQTAQQAVAPLMQRQEAIRRQQEAEGFLQDYPELQDQQAQQGLRAEVAQWGHDLGLPPNHPLLGEPAFAEVVHLASKTVARAQSENPAGGGGQRQPSVPIEQPGGGAPAPTDGKQGLSLADIKAAGTGNSFWTGG